MNASSIHFTPLQADHFPLLLQWLETPHVKAWWDQDIHWTSNLIKEKYESYVQGNKEEKGIKKPLQAYIIYIADVPIGYIQFYNAYDFMRENGFLPEGLPKSLGGLDFYIGDPDFIGKGLSHLILNKFLEDIAKNTFDACFVDPDHSNQRAIHAYEKAGFLLLNMPLEGSDLWMIKILN